MKIIFALFAIFSLNTIAFAQAPDKVLARVRYTYINKKDTLKNGKIRMENMLLFVGKNASLYTSYDQLKYQIALDQKIINIGKNLIDDGKQKTITVDLSANEWMSATNHLYFLNEGKHYIKEMISDQGYLTEETAPVLNWKISKDTLSFSGMHCQKAITNHEGKNWIVWFASSLPFQSGPWELNGLPGLIIDAYDEQKNIHFQFGGIENAKEGDFKRVTDVNKGIHADPDLMNSIDIMLGFDVANAYFSNMIKLPSHATKTTQQQLKKFKAALEKDKKRIDKVKN